MDLIKVHGGLYYSPWTILESRMRRTPEAIVLHKVDDGFYADKTSFILTMAGKQLKTIPVDLEKFSENPNYLHDTISLEIEKIIDAQFEGLDWDEYFYPRNLAPGRFLAGIMTREELLLSYGVQIPVEE